MSPILLLLIAGSSCATDNATTQLGLYAEFQHEPPAALREAAREELAAIVTPIGIRVHWRAAADSTSDPWWNRVATLQFQGRCDTSGHRTWARRPWVFGQTSVSDGSVIPYAEIHCDTLRAYLSPALSSIGPRRSTAVFGRALGRVVAHELYHILTKTRRHGAGGVGRGSFTPAELTADEFRFRDEEVRRLRLAVLPAPKGPENPRCGDRP